MTSGWGLFNGCSLDEDSVLRVLNTVPDRSELSAANLWIGNNVNWKNSEAIAQLLQTTVPIKNGTYQYKGWNVVC